MIISIAAGFVLRYFYRYQLRFAVRVYLFACLCAFPAIVHGFVRRLFSSLLNDKRDLCWALYYRSIYMLTPAHTQRIRLCSSAQPAVRLSVVCTGVNRSLVLLPSTFKNGGCGLRWSYSND